MFFINFLINCISFIGIAAAPDRDGWVSVDRPDVYMEEMVEDEDGWVVFSKQIGFEKFLVRFPEDPSCRYFQEDAMELNATQDGVIFSLKREARGSKELKVFLSQRIEEIGVLKDAVLLRVEEKEGSIELFYRIVKGEWIRERLIATADSFYTLQTMSSRQQVEIHKQFADSLVVLHLR